MSAKRPRDPENQDEKCAPGRVRCTRRDKKAKSKNTKLRKLTDQRPMEPEAAHFGGDPSPADKNKTKCEAETQRATASGLGTDN